MFLKVSQEATRSGSSVPARGGGRNYYGGLLIVVRHRSMVGVPILLRVLLRVLLGVYHRCMHRRVVVLPGHHSAHGRWVVRPCRMVARGDKRCDAAGGAGVEHLVRR